MDGVAAHLADAADRRLARAHAADRAPLALLAAQLHDRAEALDRTGAQLMRGLVGDQLPPLIVVGIRQQRRHRHLDEPRVAVEGFAIGIGELGALDEEMDELRADRICIHEVEALEQRQLLQHHRPL